MFKSEFSEVSYNEEMNVVLVKWKKFCCIDNYRKPLLYALEIIKNHKNCNYVADTRSGFENKLEDTQWLFDIWLPQVASTTCKAFFFIIDKNNKLKEELDGQSVELKKLFDVHYCFGFDEIKEILK